MVGLGNPGSEYEQTRHNAGFWFVDELASRHGGRFSTDRKFSGAHARISIDGADVRLLKPSTFMNESGKSVRAMAQFFKVPVEKILVVHDEIDLPPGSARLKLGGGHGGHNGLRDIVAQIGRDFARLRLGVGHPGNKNAVTNYVLRKPSIDDGRMIHESIADAADVMPLLVREGFEKAMTKLHTGKG
ncbi:MAG: aminoacyl-tRNA hydrolase [Gammaproteobacteria bacterium]|nr:aminoacyl-tRNA hydrolase [Gammaproteobacteria bacterium]